MSDFRAWSKLTCLLGCGRCCIKPDIEATVLEFLPLAYHLYSVDEAEDWLRKIQEHPDTLCISFQQGVMPGSGACAQYHYRGLVCRLFGYSSRTNKYGEKEFVGCKPIKDEDPAAHNATVDGVAKGNFVPVISHHYMRLHAIDPELARKFYPINEAIRRAIELVLQYQSYMGYPEPGAA